MYYHIGRPRDDVIGVFPLANVGLAVTDAVARRFGADRDVADRVLDREVARMLATGSRRGWSAGERLGFARWAPLVAALEGVADWPLAQRRALARGDARQGRAPGVRLRTSDSMPTAGSAGRWPPWPGNARAS